MTEWKEKKKDNRTTFRWKLFKKFRQFVTTQGNKTIKEKKIIETKFNLKYIHSQRQVSFWSSSYSEACLQQAFKMHNVETIFLGMEWNNNYSEIMVYKKDGRIWYYPQRRNDWCTGWELVRMAKLISLIWVTTVSTCIADWKSFIEIFFVRKWKKMKLWFMILMSRQN